MNPEWRSPLRGGRGGGRARRAGWRCATSTPTLTVEWKDDHSPVTVADREAEAAPAQPPPRRLPRRRLPRRGVRRHARRRPAIRWIIDPIDGTRSFVRGIPLWATLVGLEYKGEQIAGVADVPALGHTYRALRGDGAYRNDRRHPRLRRRRRWPTPILVLFEPVLVRQGGARRTAFLDLARRTQRQRGFGDFYGFVLVAQGSGEVMVEHGVHAWDVAALKPIVEEAGGRFTDWDGTPTIHRPDVLASNGKLHDETLRILNGKRE